MAHEAIGAHARDELGFAPNQNPVFVEVTSDADWATGIAFPAGRLVNTTFESFTSDEERREAMSSLGHYPHAAGSPFAGDAGRTRSATYGVIERCIDCTDAATRGTSIMVFPQAGGCQCGSVRYEISGERMLRIYFLQQWFNLSDPAAEEALYDAVSWHYPRRRRMPRALIEERQVRTRLAAAGSRIRTIGPAEDPRRRRDIGSRRAAFSVAASRADTSPSLETLVVSRGTDGSIRLVPAVSQTNAEGCGVG